MFTLNVIYILLILVNIIAAVMCFKAFSSFKKTMVRAAYASLFAGFYNIVCGLTVLCIYLQAIFFGA